VSIEYSTSPWGFRNYTPEEYMKVCRKIGLENVGMMFDVEGLKLSISSGISSVKIEEIKSVADSEGIKMVEFCGGGDYTLLGKGELKKQIEITKKHIDLTKEFGGNIFRLFAGWTKEEDLKDEMYHQVIYALTEIGRYASLYDIEVCMENHGGITGTVERVKRLLDNVETMNIGLNFDAANFYYYNEDPINAIDSLLDYINFTHFKDCRLVNGKIEYCRMSEGIIDYPYILRKLLSNYKAYYVIEYEEPSDVGEGTASELEYLRGLIDRLKG